MFRRQDRGTYRLSRTSSANTQIKWVLVFVPWVWGMLGHVQAAGQGDLQTVKDIISKHPDKVSSCICLECELWQGMSRRWGRGTYRLSRTSSANIQMKWVLIFVPWVWIMTGHVQAAGQGDRQTVKDIISKHPDKVSIFDPWLWGMPGHVQDLGRIVLPTVQGNLEGLKVN